MDALEKFPGSDIHPMKVLLHHTWEEGRGRMITILMNTMVFLKTKCGTMEEEQTKYTSVTLCINFRAVQYFLHESDEMTKPTTGIPSSDGVSKPVHKKVSDIKIVRKKKTKTSNAFKISRK